MALQRFAIDPIVYIDGAIAPHVKVIRIEQSHGGQRLDHAIIQVDIGRHRGTSDHPAAAEDVHIQSGDLIDTDWINKKVNIKLPAGGRLAQDKWVHLGQITKRDIEIDSEGSEVFRLVTRLLPYHFGPPLTYQRVLNVAFPNFPSYIDEEIVFNPPIEEKSVGNLRVENGLFAIGRRYFIHPESIRTTAAAAVQGGTTVYEINGESVPVVEEVTPDKWRLIDAILYILDECNGAETWIKNPTENDLIASILAQDAGRDVLHNHRLKAGSHLPTALDNLLTPYGYRWRIEYTGLNNAKIKVFKAGYLATGIPKVVKLQAPGSNLNRDETNLVRCNLSGDNKRALKTLTLYGGYTQVEAVWNLFPGWSVGDEPEDDGRIYFLLKELFDLNPQYKNVFRKFTLNEAGDNPEWPVADLTTVFSDVWSVVAGQNFVHPPIIPKRRKFLPTLTQERTDGDVRPIGHYDGIVVQIWDPGKQILDESGTVIDKGVWRNMPAGGAPWNIKVLKDECGIYFDGDFPPEELFIPLLNADGTANPEGRTKWVRVIATIQSDHKMRYTHVVPGADTFASADAHRVIDRSKSFHFRRRAEGLVDVHGDTDPTWASIYTSGAFGAVDYSNLEHDSADGSVALQTYATNAAKTYTRAEVSGTLVVEGLDDEIDYTIGDVIGEIKGRNVNFDQTPGTFFESSPSYPQVVMIRYNVQKQRQLIYIEEVTRSEEHFGRQA